MKVLLVYPETPLTFYSFKKALKFISKKSVEPPLGLLTVSSILPKNWEKRLIDTNVSRLEDRDLQWADYVFISGMDIHKESFKKIVRRCNQLSVKVVAGGPMVTSGCHEFLGVDHFILNEAEITLPIFIKDLSEGKPKRVYKTDQYPDLSKTPVPDWDLLEMKKYATMNIQYSRGCPFECEFCSISSLNGKRHRSKNIDQFITELNSLYTHGWRDDVFIVDDNFIGNKRKIKRQLLPALIEWNSSKGYPFHFTTEVSINLAEDDELLDLMARAGFEHVFIGIETPNMKSLNECGKYQNLKGDMTESINKIQNYGIRVSGGFIVGFDSDTPSIFEQQIKFIQQSGIVTAMVGLLSAPSGTKLFDRLKNEKRLINLMSGNNMDGSLNFIPKMDYHTLIKGYKEVLETIYSQKEYYERIKVFLSHYNKPIKLKPKRISFREILAFIKSLYILGIVEKGKLYYWKLLFLSLFKYRKSFTVAMTLAIYGFHFRRIVETI